jgi:4-amino-4-deoxy-L-arabinose transferase-like glycosyltransferase
MSAGLFLAVASVHFLAPGDRDRWTGLLLIFDHLFAMGLTVVLLVLTEGLGRRALLLLKAKVDSTVESLLLSTALGAGLISTALLAVGAVVGLHSWSLALVGVAACVLAGTTTLSLPRRIHGAWTELADGIGSLGLILLAGVAVILVVLSLGPAADYDSLMYHLEIPSQFLDRGRIFVPDGNLHVSFVGMFQFLYLPMLALGSPEACSLLNAAFGVFLGLGAFCLADRFFSGAVARLTFFLFWGSAMVLLVAATPKVDVTLALYLLLGHLALMKAWRGEEMDVVWLVLGGVLLGMAIGIKHLGLAYLAALVPVLVWTTWRMDASEGNRIGALGILGLAVLAGAAPWLVKNWVLLGGPFYPYLTSEILPPWLAGLHGNATLPDGVNLDHIRLLALTVEPFSLMDWFLLPETLTPEAEGGLYGANLAFLLVPLAIPLLRNPAFFSFFIPGVLFFGLAFADGPYLSLRYLVPAFPALTLAAAAGLDAMASHLSSERIRAGLLAFLAAIVLFPTGYAAYRKLSTTGALAHAAGFTSRHDYLWESRDGDQVSYSRLRDFVNATTGPEDRVLMFFEARGFGLEPDVLPDNVLLNWPLLDAVLDDQGCLEETGITHVLVGEGTLLYFSLRGFDPESIGWARSRDFAGRCLRAVESTNGFTLLEVSGASEND